MKPKHIPKQWQTWLWFAVLGLTLSYCTAEGCEDCEEPLPTEILSFTYTPNPVFVGDTVTFKVQIKDSLESGFEYYWLAYDGIRTSIGELIGGQKSADIDSRDWYKAPGPTIKWVATDTANIVVIIYNRSKTSLFESTSQTINTLNKN